MTEKNPPERLFVLMDRRTKKPVGEPSSELGEVADEIRYDYEYVEEYALKRKIPPPEKFSWQKLAELASRMNEFRAFLKNVSSFKDLPRDQNAFPPIEENKTPCDLHVGAANQGGFYLRLVIDEAEHADLIDLLNGWFNTRAGRTNAIIAQLLEKPDET